jgi:hypothetical protein
MSRRRRRYRSTSRSSCGPFCCVARPLRRETGNLLIYSTASLATEVPTVEELGGVARHYLGHEHEAAYGHAEVAAPFGAPLFCHENERATVSETCPVEGTFASATGSMTTSR